MPSVLILMVVTLHAAFGCLFLAMNRQHPARYSRLIAHSWLLEGFRALVNCAQYQTLVTVPGLTHWYSFSDCLGLVATWWTLAGCADLAGVRLSPKLGRYYVACGVPVILLLRYAFPAFAPSLFGLTPERAGFLAVLTELALMFATVTVVRLAILRWFFRLWRRTAQPGALVATLFAVPYVAFAVVNPFQFFYSYYPDWIFFVWAVRVLGFSLGLMMLVFNRHLDAQRASEETAQHLANFPELNPNPVLEFGADAKLAYHNPAARSIGPRLGVAGVEQLLPVETRDIVSACLASGEPRLQVVTAHGRHTLAWSFYPIVAQRVVHCYVEDTTDRRQLEEQLRQAQKMEAIGQLAGGVAHDFNNLLTAIIGHLGILRLDRQLPVDARESLEEISRAANRAAALTQQLLTFSRRQVITMRVLNLNELVANVSRMLGRLLGEHIAMEQHLAPDRLLFNGDTGMIEQVVINLAVNARDAMPGGGTLRLTTAAVAAPDRASRAALPAGLVCLTISDTGVGISPEIRPKIFEPFFTTKAVGQGTGLGLATAFGIVQQHRGWIEVESEPGKGAAFKIFLPRAEAEPLPVATSTLAPANSRGAGETILLVEDEAAVREIGIQVLRRQGYRVLAAADGKAALELWQRHRTEIQLLFTDIVMPGGLTGLQLAAQLLAEQPDLPVVYTSGYSREISGGGLAMVEGVNFLAKPYDLDKLFHVVRRALDTAARR